MLPGELLGNRRRHKLHAGSVRSQSSNGQTQTRSAIRRQGGDACVNARLSAISLQGHRHAGKGQGCLRGPEGSLLERAALFLMLVSG